MSKTLVKWLKQGLKQNWESQEHILYPQISIQIAKQVTISGNCPKLHLFLLLSGMKSVQSAPLHARSISFLDTRCTPEPIRPSAFLQAHKRRADTRRCPQGCFSTSTPFIQIQHMKCSSLLSSRLSVIDQSSTNPCAQTHLSGNDGVKRWRQKTDRGVQNENSRKISLNLFELIGTIFTGVWIVERYFLHRQLWQRVVGDWWGCLCWFSVWSETEGNAFKVATGMWCNAPKWVEQANVTMWSYCCTILNLLCKNK